MSVTANLVWIWGVSLQSKVMSVVLRIPKTKGLKKFKKNYLAPIFNTNLAPLFSGKLQHILIQSVNTYSTCATCENSAAMSSSHQSTGIDQLVTQQESHIGKYNFGFLRLVKNHRSFSSCLELGNDIKDMSPKTVSKF